MKTQAARRSSLFLMELIMAILFFALASAVCVQLFAKAHLTGQATQDLNGAVSQCQSFAEAAYGSEDPYAVFPKAVQDNKGGAVLSFDQDWQPADSGSNQITITARQEGSLRTYHLIATDKDEKTVYTLDVDVYLAKTKEADHA